MFRFSKTFFSQSAAERFAQGLNRKYEIWIGNDGFGQTQYTVKWN